jgi:PPOX class probable F420-dependent enzyme
MRSMTADEVRSFLTAGTRTAKIATVRPDGRPHVVPVWFDVDDDRLVFSTSSTSVKARNLLADPRVAVTVDEQVAPFAFVTVAGVATCMHRPDDFLSWTTRIARRYVGDGRAEEVGRSYVSMDDLLVQVRIISMRGFAEVVD